MSEDIDIKVLLAPTEKPLKKGRGDRVRLKALHDHLPTMLGMHGISIASVSRWRKPSHS